MKRFCVFFVYIFFVFFHGVYAEESLEPVLLTGTSVVPDDKPYYKYKQNNVEIIYTKENLPFAKHTASIEEPLNKDYEDVFSWKLDSTLYIGLISDCNQIANGFSTQWPKNNQINYIGGTQYIDYFSSISWLDTLLYHETAHNYQLNVKANPISQALYTVFGNGTFILPFPYVIVPNVTENPFMLEGSAVLNESWHGNGGRLYSGRFKAQTILQAKAGKIKASDVYNVKLDFPYGERAYIQGGFYNLYMAEKYGIVNLNSYFKEHSYDIFWPQFTNASMLRSVGVDFESSLDAFAKEYADKAQEFVLASGKLLGSSQFFYSLGSDKDEVFFITNESGYSTPSLVVYSKKDALLSRYKNSWLGGKVLKVDGKYYTQGSKHVSATRIYQGLFDSDAYIKEDTSSKMVQGYLANGDMVYFDVATSFLEAQLYVGNQFYTKSNSSVLVEGEDIYYFIQEDKTRTLYKNKTPLYSYEGFYGIICDVDSNGVLYFVANSKNGSTLYRYDNGKVSRATSADNVLEAKLVNDDEVIFGAINDKEYYYVRSELENIEQTPYETKLFFEKKNYYGKYKHLNKAKVDLSQPYSALLDMHYSGTNFLFAYTGDNILGKLDINFADPLSQNALSLNLSRDENNVSVTGLTYSNSKYLLEYVVSTYKVVDKSDYEDIRESGVILGAILPFYKKGYNLATFALNYYQSYDATLREPLSFSINLSHSEAYGISMYYNYLNAGMLYGSKERDDLIYGGKYEFNHELGFASYIGFSVKYSKTNSDISALEAAQKNRGVKITNISYQLDMDPSTIYIPSLESSYYLESAGYIDVSLSKVFDFSSYWFTFPLSLQREALYLKYRTYNIKSFSGYSETFNEITAGVTLSTIMLNKFVIPVSFEYIHNNANFIDEENSFKFILGTRF